MTKSLKTLGMTRLRRPVLQWAVPEQGGGGASNKYTFRKISQLGFSISCFRKDLRLRNACHSSTIASFSKYAFAKH